MYPARRIDPFSPTAAERPAADAHGAARPFERSMSSPVSAEPSWQEYRIGTRIRLHPARQPAIVPDGTAPQARTRAGIAKSLATSRTAVTHALGLLEDGGAVSAIPRHFENRRRRAQVYDLTGAGEGLVEHIRQGMGR